MTEGHGVLFWMGWLGKASLTRCLLSRYLHGVREGKVNIWGKTAQEEAAQAKALR